MDNVLKLVNALGKHIGDELTLRELASIAKVPYTTANRVMKSAGLFTLRKKGNIILCSLNTKDPITKSYLIIAERMAQKKFFMKNPGYKMIAKDLLESDLCVILFGSRAQENAREKSDVDICVITKTGKNGKKITGFSQFEMLYQLEVNALSFSEEEFIQMLKSEEENVAKQIMKKHILLYGETYFWEVTWDGI
jgi:predicted nucleotidyltransferase